MEPGDEAIGLLWSLNAKDMQASLSSPGSHGFAYVILCLKNRAGDGLLIFKVPRRTSSCLTGTQIVSLIPSSSINASSNGIDLLSILSLEELASHQSESLLAFPRPGHML